MKLTRVVLGVMAAAFLAGCASTESKVGATSSEKSEAGCCKAGAAQGKSCCSEGGACTEKKTEGTAQKN
jgi:hypothetical protein